MSERPEVRVLHGSPTADEAAAVEQAILAIWRQESAAAARAGGIDPWVLAARREAVGLPPAALRGLSPAGSWRLSGRFAPTPETHLTPGRGDAK